MNSENVTFSFGENWSDFVEGVSEADVARAALDIDEWLGKDTIRDKRVIDVGSGSGIHSLSFLKLGAKSIHSFDYDPKSVDATRKLHELAGRPSNWKVEHGSVLDADYVHSLGTFDIVYSWGVLHHTGAMWDAITNCVGLVAPGGRLWIALYAKGPRYEADMALKRKYNAASSFGKRFMVGKKVLRIMLGRAKHLKNPFTWNKKSERGMNIYHDLIDWLGGLPYETASEDEVVRFARQRGFVLERILPLPEGACSTYVFSLPQTV